MAINGNFFFKKSFLIITECPSLSLLMFLSSRFVDLLVVKWHSLSHLAPVLTHPLITPLCSRSLPCNFTGPSTMTWHTLPLTLTWGHPLKQNLEIGLYFGTCFLGQFPSPWEHTQANLVEWRMEQNCPIILAEASLD